MPLDTYFGVRKNVIFERAKFISRNQRDGESVEQYVVDLHSLTRNCNFGALVKSSYGTVGFSPKQYNSERNCLLSSTFDKPVARRNCSNLRFQ